MTADMIVQSLRLRAQVAAEWHRDCRARRWQRHTAMMDRVNSLARLMAAVGTHDPIRRRAMLMSEHYHYRAMAWHAIMMGEVERAAEYRAKSWKPWRALMADARHG